MTESAGLTSYAHAIALDTPFDRGRGAARDRAAFVNDVAEWLARDAGMKVSDLPRDLHAHRTLITHLLTIRPPRPFPAEVLRKLDALFAEAAAERPDVTASDLLTQASALTTIDETRLCLWRGDITTLALDAIVNAANADLLGCFQPGHSCIDNAIHTVAGPRLREDCQRIREIQGHREPTGTAKVTRAYFLPSRFVLHTVGPIVGNGRVTPSHEAALADCYRACLELAAEVHARSLAFCAISTGVFGYPKVPAATVAICTVNDWLRRHPHAFDLVVFNVFSEQDVAAYRDAGGLS